MRGMGRITRDIFTLALYLDFYFWGDSGVNRGRSYLADQLEAFVVASLKRIEAGGTSDPLGAGSNRSRLL